MAFFPITTMPDSVTVKFFLSLSGSNPISYPSGIVTFLSMIALRILACLPMLQLYIIIESVTYAKLLILTFGPRIDLSTSPPEIIEPSQISEFILLPTLSPS